MIGKEMRKIRKIGMMTGAVILGLLLMLTGRHAEAASWTPEEMEAAVEEDTAAAGGGAASEDCVIDGNMEAAEEKGSAENGAVSGNGAADGMTGENAAAEVQADSVEEEILAGQEQSQASSGGLQFELDGERVAVVGYTGNGPEVVIPDQMWGRPVAVIRQGAFTDDEKIQKITFGKNITTIEKYSCNRMEKLRSLSIPASVRKIGMSAFNECEVLTSLSFEAGDTTLTLTCGSFTGCGKLASIDLSMRPIKGVSYDGNQGGDGKLFSGAAIEELTVPASVDFSELYSFCADCKNLKKITITAKSIKNYSFSGCTSLEEAVLYDTEVIRYGAFSRCAALKRVSLPESLKTIESDVFGDCQSLEQIQLPSGLETIGSSAFIRCTGLKEIHIPEKVSSLGAACFQECTSLTAIHIPAGVSLIGERFLEGCIGLKEITADEGNLLVTARAGILYDKNVTTLLRAAYQLEKLEIPDTVAVIDSYSCTDMQCLSSFVVPGSVTKIKSGAFRDNDVLGRLEFAGGGSPLEIEDHAFDESVGLKHIEFGTRQIVMSGTRTFRRCGVEEVTLPETVDTAKASSLFEECGQLKRVYVTAQSMGRHLFGQCTSLETAVLEGMTEISPSLFTRCTSLRRVIIPEGVEVIQECAFYGAGLQEISLPRTLRAIKYRAFADSELTAVEIPMGVEEISLKSFEGCGELESICVDEQNACYASEGNMLFDKEMETLLYLPRNGYGASQVTIPANVKRIGTGVLSNLLEIQWIAFDGDIPVGVYEPHDVPPLVPIGFSAGRLPADAWLFYDEGCPAWADTSVISIPASHRIPITGKMRQLKGMIEGINPADIKAADKDFCTSLRQRYGSLNGSQQIWVGGADVVEGAYQRACGLYVKNLIQALPAKEKLAWTDKDAVRTASQEYEELDEAGKKIVGTTSYMKLNQLVEQLEQILQVSMIKAEPVQLVGEAGGFIVLNTEIRPSYAENQTLSCQLADLELAEYTTEESGKKITFHLKRAGRTTATLAAVDGSGVTLDIPLVSRLQKPHGTAVQQHGSVAEVKWEKVSQAERYRVYCSVDGGEYKECGNTSTLLFVYNGLREGSTYRYRVMAISGGGYDSEMSTETAELRVEKGSIEENPTGSPKPAGKPEPTGGAKPTGSPVSTGGADPTGSLQNPKASLKLNYSSLPLQKGKSTTVVKLKSSVPANAVILSAKTSSPSVASVKVKNGKLTITGKKAGTARITVNGSNQASAVVKITVKKKVTASKLALNKKKAALKKGQKLTLKVVKTPVTAADQITWKSSDQKIATVTSKGVVKAKKKGKVTITARASGGKKAVCTIKIQ